MEIKNEELNVVKSFLRLQNSSAYDESIKNEMIATKQELKSKGINIREHSDDEEINESNMLLRYLKLIAMIIAPTLFGTYKQGNNFWNMQESMINEFILLDYVGAEDV